MTAWTETEVGQVDVSDVPTTFDESVVLLDVREHDEWQRGHAAGAQHIPMGEVPARIGEIDPGAKLFVVCQLGGRSLRVAQYLAAERICADQRQRRHAGLGRCRHDRSSPTAAAPAPSEQPSLGWSDDPGVFPVRHAVERAGPAASLVPAV